MTIVTRPEKLIYNLYLPIGERQFNIYRVPDLYIYSDLEFSSIQKINIFERKCLDSFVYSEPKDVLVLFRGGGLELVINDITIPPSSNTYLNMLYYIEMCFMSKWNNNIPFPYEILKIMKKEDADIQKLHDLYLKNQLYTYDLFENQFLVGFDRNPYGEWILEYEMR